MKDLLEKLSSYNIFNYLVPGVLFVCLAKALIGYDFTQENLILGFFLYYFFGMVISRTGSLFIEPLLRKSKFIKFADYKRYVKASKKEEKIEVFSEINNTYRTLLTMLLLLLILKGYSSVNYYLNISSELGLVIASILMGFIFLLSYRKQTQFVVKRIEVWEETERDQKDA